ncbi:aspartate aminotransferase family protein [Sinomicrobium kalidii]|uniref:pyridoxal phosphate-dependent decarboxylase family protein n=1 Tax=Sinomicrobium kalidii TaxID=2900738 RepID=UPI001E58DF8D|nr:aspartate aminotransferase family protein [Sinomicrobium kalidii]UGU17584.1 aspartate aminotransferase family protein [Sinomicrobium kalidii]
MNETLMNEEVPSPTVLSSREELCKDIFYEQTCDEYVRAIRLAQERVTGFLKNNRKPFSGIKPADIRTRVEAVDFEVPLPDYESLLNEVDELYVKHATAYHLPQYIAHLNCPVVIPALAAEVLISAINSSQDTYDQSAGGTFMERKLIAWTGAQIGFPSDCDGIFTAGGSQSNLMGLLLARDFFALKHLNRNIKLDGCPPEATRFRVFVSGKAHFSNHKNASIMGLGEQAIVHVETDGRYRMDPQKLEEAIAREREKGNIPIAVMATAGTTDFGNVDPLSDIAHTARKHRLWLHVDAAYGCGLLLTEKYRHLLAGIEQADSVTVDYHKSFFQPISSSAFIVRNKLHLNIIKHHADYLNPKEQDYDELPAQINKSIVQSTRRFDALKLWCTLRYLGKEKLGQYTDTIIETTREAADSIENDDSFELLCHSDMGVLVFRYTEGSEKDELCKLNQYIKKSLFFSGEVLLASTKVNGAFYLKFTIFNPLTTITDIQNILTIIKQHGHEYLQLNRVSPAGRTDQF